MNKYTIRSCNDDYCPIDPRFISNSKLKTEDIIRPSFNGLHPDSKKIQIYAECAQISFQDAIYYSQACHNCNKTFGKQDIIYGNMYCSSNCESKVKRDDKLCYYSRVGENCKICVQDSNSCENLKK